jgi:hypothetical protein
MLSKTVDYLDAFSRFKKKENVEAVERLLSAHKEFHKFERAQLGTPPISLPVSSPRWIFLSKREYKRASVTDEVFGFANRISLLRDG